MEPFPGTEAYARLLNSPISQEDFNKEIEKLQKLLVKKVEENPHYPVAVKDMTPREFEISKIVSYYCGTTMFVRDELENLLRRLRLNGQ